MNRSPVPFARFRPHLAAFTVYLVAAVVVTYPLITVMNTRLAGWDYSDAYEMAHHIWWFGHALQTGQPLFDQPLLGYPDGISGITLWSNPLQFFPAWGLALIVGVPAAFNLVLLVTMALNGWAMFFLARALLARDGDRDAAALPALIAGLVYMLYPTMQGHLGAAHGGLMVQWGVPLYVYTLFRLRDAPAPHMRQRVLAGALWLLVSVWGHTLQLIYVVLPVTVWFALWLLVERRWRALARVSASFLLGGLALGVFLVPVASATLGTAAYVAEGGTVRYSADLLALVTPSFLHPLYGRLDYTHRVLGVNLDEGAAYIGVVVGLLCALAFARTRAARPWLWLALAAYVLSLGPLLKLFDQPVTLRIGGDFPTAIVLPFAALERLPLFNLARTPGRFNFTLALAAAALAAYGAAWALARVERQTLRRALALIVMLALAFDYVTFFPLPTTSALVPDAIAALRDRDDVRAVFDVPWDNLVTAKTGLFLQTAHAHPLIAGHVTRRTPVDPAKLSVLEATLNTALLEAAGADVVIVHREQDTNGALEARARAQLGAPTYRDERFAMFETPSADTLPPLTALPLSTSAVAQTAHVYLYAPSAGWATLSADLSADVRSLAVAHDGVTIYRAALDGTTPLALPLALAPGYHTLTFAVEPPCPLVYDAALRCRTVALDALAITGSPLVPTVRDVTFERGVTLAAAGVWADDSVTVRLAWRFAAPLAATDTRFVHVLDGSGALVAQSDVPAPDFAAQGGWNETLDFPLPPGDYRVYTGWYRYPDGTRFTITSDIAGRRDGWVELGAVTVAQSAQTSQTSQTE